MRIGHDQLWLWITLGVVLLLVAGGLVAGYFARRRRLTRLGTAAALERTIRARAPGLRTIRKRD